MKLLLVCGGQSTEHAVSRMSCVNIYKIVIRVNMILKLQVLQKKENGMI